MSITCPLSPGQADHCRRNTVGHSPTPLGGEGHVELDDTLGEVDVVQQGLSILEKQRVALPLSEERRADVDVGTKLRIDYSYFPRSTVVRIHEWQVVP